MNEAPLIEVLQKLKDRGILKIALLFGSYARGATHPRSDIDLALFLDIADPEEEMAAVDDILMASEREIGILRLDDEEESPFVVQAALKGEHLVEPDEEALYAVYRRALHEAEAIRFRREWAGGQN
jgi:uncharacterized protein